MKCATNIHIATFDPQQADTVASWVRTPDELRWLAPSSVPPLTGEKVRGWRKPGGEAFVGLDGVAGRVVCYGELNPMRHEAEHYWLGHVIVDPSRRGAGIGEWFVRELLREAIIGRGAKKISLIVFPENETAIRCYERVGFRRTGKEHHRFAANGPLQCLLRLEAGGLVRVVESRVEHAVPAANRGRGA